MERLPILRFGAPYESADIHPVMDYRGDRIVDLSLAIPALFKTDLARHRDRSSSLLRHYPVRTILKWIQDAGQIFATKTIRIHGASQSPEQYVESVVRSTGLPYRACHEVLQQMCNHMGSMPTILEHQCRAPLEALDSNIVEYGAKTFGWIPSADILCIALPGNHPIVNMMWIIAFAAKYPVMIRPSFDDPFTSLRLIYSLIEAGADPEFFGYYPCSHSDAFELMKAVGRGIIFGGHKIVQTYGAYPWMRAFGPGSSKIVVGEPWVDRIEEVAEWITASALFHAGRACLSTSSVLATRNGEAIAQAVARRFASIAAQDPMRPGAVLAAAKDKRAVAMIAAEIDMACKRPGVQILPSPDAMLRSCDGMTFLQPQVALCCDAGDALFGKEYPFPFVSIVEAEESKISSMVGSTLACTCLAQSESLLRALLRSPQIEKVYANMDNSTCMDFGSPHQGFLLDFLYQAKTFKQTNHSKEHPTQCSENMKSAFA